MTQPATMVGLFLRAHEELHPAGSEIAQLRAAGVGGRRICTLYPYSLGGWLPQLTARLQGAAPGYNLAARLGGVAFTLLMGQMPQPEPQWRWNVRGEVVGEGRYAAALDGILTANGEPLAGSQRSSIFDAFATAHELISIAANWHAFPELHVAEPEYVRLTSEALSALLPDIFAPRYWS